MFLLGVVVRVRVVVWLFECPGAAKMAASQGRGSAGWSVTVNIKDPTKRKVTNDKFVEAPTPAPGRGRERAAAAVAQVRQGLFCSMFMGCQARFLISLVFCE